MLCCTQQSLEPAASRSEGLAQNYIVNQDVAQNSRQQEIILFEDLTGSPYVDEIATEAWVLDDDGMLAIPDKPGVGLTLEMEVVEKYSSGESFPE